jgi:hypothetical protein
MGSGVLVSLPRSGLKPFDLSGQRIGAFGKIIEMAPQCDFRFSV